MTTVTIEHINDIYNLSLILPENCINYVELEYNINHNFRKTNKQSSDINKFDDSWSGSYENNHTSRSNNDDADTIDIVDVIDANEGTFSKNKTHQQMVKLCDKNDLYYEDLILIKYL